MSTSKEFKDYVCECLSRAGDISMRAMMGEYCVYSAGKVIGLLCDNMLLLKQTDTSVKLLPNAERRYPYEGSRTLMLVVEDFEDTELMAEILSAITAELPDSNAKKERKKK